MATCWMNSFSSEGRLSSQGGGRGFLRGLGLTPLTCGRSRVDAVGSIKVFCDLQGF